VKIGEVAGGVRQGVGEQVEPLLDVQPAEEEHDELAGKLGIIGFESGPRGEVVKRARG